MEEQTPQCWEEGHKAFPTQATARLILRPFSQDDAAQVAALAGDARIARMTASVPHPYKVEDAEAWIAGQAEAYCRGQGLMWAVVHKENQGLLGAIGITIKRGDNVGPLAY